MDECHIVDESFLELEKLCEKSLTTMGQSESKKSSSFKKMHGPETKGTSISFGFKKKNCSTANKKQQIIKVNANNNNSINREKEEQAQKATIISNLNVITAEQNNFIIVGDNNGNTNSAITTSVDEKNFIRTTSPAKLQPAKRDQLYTGKSNRFGFRQNVIRPSSAAITPKFNEFDNVNNNNVCRAKSATTTQLRLNAQVELKPTKSLIDQHNTTSVGNNGVEIDANSITNRSTSAASQNQTLVVSRYTLQSTSLPRPQYPVPVSVAPSTFARNTLSTFSLNTSSRPVNSVQSKLIDTKGAKHQANLTKRGGMMTRRDESLDSGIASHDSTSDNNHYHNTSIQKQPQPPSQLIDTSMKRSRRRFEMIPGPSRHKFEIRDLNDYNENTVIVPLSLPKLPTERREIVTNGLIRSTNSYTTDNETDISISESSRPTSFISTASETESFEEEKLKIDTSCSEKSSKGAIAKENVKTNIKNSSSVSWKQNNNGGESMAMNISRTVSISSSSDDDRKNQNIIHSFEVNNMKKKDIDCDEDELSSMTITADHSSYFDSMTSKTSPSKDQKETVNDAFLKQQQASQKPKLIGSISRKELFIEVDEVKFAETVEAAKNLALLDDETSPSESLVSSSNSESGDIPMKKIKESKQIDEIKEEEELIDEVTPELVDLVSPCSPTHASNSFSLSDAGRDDFLIDDEIADQPALMISTKKQTGSHAHHDEHRSISIAMNVTSDCTTTTPTLKDISINSHGSLRSLNKLQALKTIKSDQSSPAVNRKTLIERSGSLDTLSPCDSIASDDLMADFDLASSLDSIDRHEHSVGDLRIHSENEVRQLSSGTACGINEYGAILKPSVHQNVQRRRSRENITMKNSDTYIMTTATDDRLSYNDLEHEAIEAHTVDVG
ncbi:hypothetical protein PVAND_008033 [Polypedilum vanderplanki]|uniref:Uncharacterized protein n=1 Tax=Polypedilum vanderplanki TaxID=319348 RepID=A0A9J6C8T7_POLVA|nr:hypothetical protein PVAND_008033 [Polypedilum vanderplanki]